MRYRIITVATSQPEEAVKLLENELPSIDFHPNFGLIIFTTSYYGKHEKVVSFLKKRLKFDTVTFFSDGFGSERGIFMHGILIIMLQVEHKVFITGKGDIGQELGRIADNISDCDIALAVYPALYFPGKSSLLKGFIRDRYYWFRYRRCKSERCKKKILRKYSNWIQKERYFIPVNRVLRALGKARIPVASINLVPIEVHEETPLILYNFEPVGKNVLVVGLKDAELYFKDIFPERGESYEETKEILGKFFALKDEVTIVKEGNVIGEINGLPVKDYIKKRFELEMAENEFVEKLEKGELSAITPFGLAMISGKTYGSSVVGLQGFPLNFYPFYLEFENYFDQGLVIGEVFSQKPHEFVDFGEKMMDGSLKLFFVDSTSLLAYRGETYEIHDFLSGKLRENFLIIFSSLPSARLEITPEKKLISEIEPGIFFFASGTSLMLKFVIS